MKNFSKKKLLVIFVLTVFISGTFSPIFYARASLPVIDSYAIADALEHFLKTAKRWIEVDYQKILRDQVVKTMVDRLTDDIVRSIYNEGDPSYVKDWKSYLSEGTDVAFNDLNNQLKSIGVNLCSPFMPNIRVNLSGRLNYGYGRLPLECTFQDFKNNLKNTGHFIESGGWVSYDAMLVPSNNYWLTSIMIEDEYNAKVRAETEARKNEALSSSGFLSQKECVEYGSISGSDIQILKNATCNSGDKACLSQLDKNYCTKWRALTPGDVVAKSATEAIGLQSKYLVNVQSVISALVNVMIMKILDKTSGGFSGASDDSNSGGQNYNYYDETGGSDQANNFDQSTLSDIISQYQEFISYVEGLLVHVNNGLDSTVNCDSNKSITYIDIDGNEQASTVGDLVNSLNLAKSYLEGALADANDGLSFTGNYDPTDPNSTQTSIIQAIDNYEALSNRYPLIINDIIISNSGAQGDLEIIYKNMSQALTSACSVAMLFNNLNLSYLYWGGYGYNLSS